VHWSRDKDTFVSCTAISIAKQEIKSFSKEECHFGYRESVFKMILK
jgi:UDP-N-acetylmuramate dehydrogenase